MTSVHSPLLISGDTQVSYLSSSSLTPFTYLELGLVGPLRTKGFCSLKGLQWTLNSNNIDLDTIRQPAESGRKAATARIDCALCPSLNAEAVRWKRGMSLHLQIPSFITMHSIMPPWPQQAGRPYEVYPPHLSLPRPACTIRIIYCACVFFCFSFVEGACLLCTCRSGATVPNDFRAGEGVSGRTKAQVAVTACPVIELHREGVKNQRSHLFWFTQC